MSEDASTPAPRGERSYRLALVGLALLLVVAAVVYRSASHSDGSSNDVTHGVGPTANSSARDALKKQGVDPSSKLRYSHYLYFSSETDAKAAAAALADDFTAEVSPPGGGVKEWEVLATQTVALNARALNDLTIRLSAIAEHSHGTYDGWEVALGA